MMITTWTTIMFNYSCLQYFLTIATTKYLNIAYNLNLQNIHGLKIGHEENKYKYMQEGTRLFMYNISGGDENDT